MKTRAMFAVVLMLPAACAFADPATQPAAAAFDKIKSLAGEWKGKNAKGEPMVSTFELAAKDSTVVEKMHMDMITMYTLDKDRVVLTHYCVAENQPRMTASALTEDGKTLDFKFLDATGMKDANEGHMHHVKFTFIDPDHIKEEWTFNKDGKDTFCEPIELERVKR